MNLSPDDVAIGRVRLRAPRREHQRSVDELQRASWPRSGHDEWVFIRQVKVSAPRPWLGLQAAGEARRMAKAAVRAAAHNVDKAEAVRFENLADLLAWLSADLVAGRAPTRWFWRRWAHLFRLPVAEALRSLWDEHIAHLSSVTERLAEIGALPTVWQSLMPSQALQLQASLSHHAQVVLPLPTGARALESARTEYSAPPEYLQSRWQGALGTLDPVDPRRWLAASLVALEWRPLLLRHEPELELTRISAMLTSDLPKSSSNLAHGATPPMVKPAATRARDWRVEQPTAQSPEDLTKSRSIQANRAAPPGVEPAATRSRALTVEQSTEQSSQQPPDRYQRRLVGEAEESSYSEVTPPPVGNTGADRYDARRKAFAASAPPGRSAIAHGRPESDGTGAVRGDGAHADQGRKVTATQASVQRAQAVATAGVESSARVPAAGQRPGILITENNNPTTTDNAEATTAGAGIYTEQGGLFYLINFLNRPEVAELLSPHGGMEILPDGWAWLWRLGMEWGLDPSGSLARLLAEQMGLDEVSELAAIPSLPAREDLLALGRRLYGEQEIWNETLLAVPAWVQHTPSHVDVYYPLAAVRLPVRLAGLDINPGWVTWLGRVVTFFYKDSLVFSSEAGE